jgi:hypothetical protein
LIHSSFFLFNQFTTHVSVFVSVHAFVNAGLNDRPPYVLWSCAGALFLTWLGTYAVVASRVKPRFRRLFYSTETNSDYLRRMFSTSKGDIQKMRIFNHHPKKWMGIRGEVQEWCLSKWPVWTEEAPPWFKQDFQEMVPDGAFARAKRARRRGEREEEQASEGSATKR